MKRFWIIPTLLVFLRLGSSAVSQPQKGIRSEIQTSPDIVQEDHHDTSLPLRVMVRLIPLRPSQPLKTREALPWRRTGPPILSSEPDAALQEFTINSPIVSVSNLRAFGGIPNRDGLIPPDTNAAIGATQIVETVNVSYQVFNKSGGSLLGPAEISSLWAGFGGVCQSGPSYSDPIVLYDKAAGRWMLSVIASNNGFASGTECIAISATSDATGSYYRYAFSFANLNDYPKFGVWPDAYYASYNMFFSSSFLGAQACAYNRSAMLAGSAASAVCFQRSTSDASLLPSDLDGSTQPPSGEPNFYLERATSTSLNLFRFHVDFTNPSNSTFTGPFSIAVASYSEACGGGTCIPQSGTNQLLDSLGDRLMHRLAYRNFGDHEALVASHSVTSGTSVGVRWYEIRSPDSTPSLYQQGTYAPDANYRWMGSIAMDRNGDIALGYSVSGSSMFPTIRVTGRAPSDPLGAMGTETTVISGGGAQTGPSSRWGDYTSMAIDPTSDLTFVYANEYYATSGSTNWSTEVASFSLAPGRSPFTSWTQSDGPHFVYEDAGGHMHQIYYVIASGSWLTQDVTAMSGAPAAVSGSDLTSWTQSDGPHFVYEDAGGHVHQIYYVIASGSWLTLDLTAMTGAPPAE